MLCDVEDDKTHTPTSVAPRANLRRQIDHAAGKHCHDLEAAGWYIEDYHMLQVAQVAKPRPGALCKRGYGTSLN